MPDIEEVRSIVIAGADGTKPARIYLRNAAGDLLLTMDVVGMKRSQTATQLLVAPSGSVDVRGSGAD